MLDVDHGGQFGDGEDAAGVPPLAGEPLGLGGDPVVPPGDGVRGDLEQLEAGGGRGAEERQPAGGSGEPAVSGGGGQGARAAGRAVQQQVQARCGEPGEGVGVAQSAGAADRVAGAAAVGERVAQRADAQPALVLVAAHGLGEPGGLVAADEAVLLLLAVAVGDGGVESGDDGAQFGDREEGPGLVAVEDGVQSLVEPAEQAGVVAPLGPVRRLRCHLVGLAGVEVGQGGGLVHVLCARDDHHALGRQVELGAQGGEEAEGLVALAGAAGGGEVAGDDHQVGGRGSRVPEHDQVAADLAAERVGFAAPPEVGPGQVQDGHGVVAAAAAPAGEACG